ncbi:MAG TPA: hypothetical protein VFG25_07120 [Nitrosopumilaceae archaeon]|nr:hypothetical protein [Nitrosopumilaceae archaeon]
MKFVKRDLILLAGSFLVFLGLSGYVEDYIAVIISAGIFFGIKTFTHSRQKFLEKHTGEGFCAQCGSQIINKKCPNCDKSEKS